MLTEQQKLDVWDRQIQAEIRSYYFADLTQTYTRQKQFITFVGFFLSSGAAATLIGKAPTWVPVILALVVALLTAYSVAVGLDGKTLTFSKLHREWSLLAMGYERLRTETDAEDSPERLSVLLTRDLEASQLGATDAPNDEKRIDRWTDQVFQSHRLVHG